MTQRIVVGLAGSPAAAAAGLIPTRRQVIEWRRRLVAAELAATRVMRDLGDGPHVVVPRELT